KGGSIFCLNLVVLNSYTILAPETKTTDPREKTHKKNVGFTKRLKKGNSTPSPPEIHIDFRITES
ncbi:MAG: hypothetical protein ACRC8J_06680, partial [Phocaeicola sp.]